MFALALAIDCQVNCRLEWLCVHHCKCCLSARNWPARWPLMQMRQIIALSRLSVCSCFNWRALGSVQNVVITSDVTPLDGHIGHPLWRDLLPPARALISRLRLMSNTCRSTWDLSSRVPASAPNWWWPISRLIEFGREFRLSASVRDVTVVWG